MGLSQGTLTLLEGMMLVAFPSTDQRGDPHINSKIHVWNKHYSALYSMFDGSDIGLFNSSHMVWMSQKINVLCGSSLRNKPFPFYNDWKNYFRKDRANGDNSTSFSNVVQNVLNQNNRASPAVGDNPTPEIPLFQETSQGEFTSSVVGRVASSRIAKGNGKGKGRNYFL
ncbi:hypothetical protein ACS0TY_029259 [Phlomoides rotata]